MKIRNFCILTVTLLIAPAPSLWAQELNEEIFQQLHASINPQDETWKSIPWQTDLLLAQNRAAKTRKPLFIWTMDGHPLGCT